MRYTISALLCCLSLTTFSQLPSRIDYYQNKEGKLVYEIPFEEAQVLDMWARKGVNAEHIIQSCQELVQQVAALKVESDKIQLLLQKENSVLKTALTQANQNYEYVERQLQLCTEQEAELVKDRDKFKSRMKNARAQRNITWGTIILVVGIALISNS